MPARLMATALLAVPAATLGFLTWYGASDPDGRAAACRSWSVQFRHAREDLATVERLWRSGAVRPPDRSDFRARVATLSAARPARCDNNGFLTVSR